MLILTNQLDFLITYIWEAFNQRACKSNEIIIDSTGKCSNHDFLLEQLKNYQGGRNPHAQKSVERYCELANKKTEQLHKVSSPCFDDHISRKRKLNRIEKCQKYAHKWSWNASTCHELVGQTFCVRSTNLQLNSLGKMFESRISAGATEKVPGWEKHQAQTAAWSYDMEGHAQKCVERCFEPANKKVEQLYRV